jgi:hypothetical protein
MHSNCRHNAHELRRPLITLRVRIMSVTCSESSAPVSCAGETFGCLQGAAHVAENARYSQYRYALHHMVSVECWGLQRNLIFHQHVGLNN